MTTAKAAEQILEILNSLEVAPTRPTRTIRLTPKEFKKNRKQLDIQAAEFTNQINTFSNINRVIDLNAYLNLIEQFSGTLSSEENLYFMQKSQEFFDDNFGAQIKNRGENTKIVEQIIKRTGRESKLQLETLLIGFSAPELANQIKSYEDLVETEQLILVNNLKFLNQTQLSEVLWEFERIPANRIASFIHSVLTQDTDRLTLVSIVLKNKTQNEIDEIVECLEDGYILKHGKAHSCLADFLNEQTTKPHIYRKAMSLFTGFEIEPWVDKIKKLINNYPELNDILAKRLTQRTGKACYNVNSYQEASNPDHYFQPFLLSAFNFLTEEQFEEIIEKANQGNKDIKIKLDALEDFFSEKLVKVINRLEKAIKCVNDPNLFTLTFSDYSFCLNEFDQFFFYDTETPEEELMLAALAPLFCIEGRNLHRIKRIIKSTEKKHLNNWLANLSGKASDNPIIKLASDGLALRLDRKSCQDYLRQVIEEADYQPEEKVSHYADKIAQFIENSETSASDKAIKIINLLMKIPYQQVEEVYLFYSYKYRISLIRQLTGVLAPAAIIKLRVLLEGFNPRQLLNNNDLDNGNIPHRLDPLESAWLQHESEGKDANSQIQNTLNMLPLASNLKNKLFSKWKSLDTGYILNQFKTSAEFSIIERIYDFQFASFELSAEPSYGNLRNTFLIAANNGNIQREEYCQIINRSENLPTKLTSKILGLARDSDKVLEQATALQQIFREKRDKLAVIKMLYLILDQEKPLRERIYQFKIFSKNESRTLILLDGYDAEQITEEVIQLVNSKDFTLEKLINLFVSERMPSDENWLGEIHHQIRLIYEEKTGKRILNDIIDKSNADPLTALESGTELNQVVIFIYSAMGTRANLIYKEISEASITESYQKVLNKILTYKPAQIERLDHCYQSLHGIKIMDVFSNEIDHHMLAPLKKLVTLSEKWEEDKLAERIERNKPKETTKKQKSSKSTKN